MKEGSLLHNQLGFHGSGQIIATSHNLRHHCQDGHSGKRNSHSATEVGLEAHKTTHGGVGGQAEAVVSQAFILFLALLAADDKNRALEAAEKDKKGALHFWYFLDVSLWLSHALANGEAMGCHLAQEVQQNIQARIFDLCKRYATIQYLLSLIGEVTSP